MLISRAALRVERSTRACTRSSAANGLRSAALHSVGASQSAPMIILSQP